MTIDWQLKTFDELNNYEVYEILRLRNRIFIVGQQSIYLDADNYDLKAMHLCAFHDNKIIAHARLFRSGEKIVPATFGRVLVDEHFRKYGIGRELVKRSIDTLHLKYKEDTIQIEAQLYLRDFYGDFGFTPSGEPYIEDNIPHIRMIRNF